MPQELPLDEVAAAACEAVIGGVDRTQVSRLLEVLEGSKNVDVVLAFLAKQVGRGYWKDHKSASRLFDILKNRDLEAARTILGIFKWLYEAGGERDREKEKKKKEKLQKLKPSRPAKRNFYYDYVNACLEEV